MTADTYQPYPLLKNNLKISHNVLIIRSGGAREMRNEALIKLLFSVFVTATTIFVVTTVIVLGLEALTKPYILVPIISVLGSSSAYFEMLGTKKSSKSLRYIGRMFLVIGLATLILLIIKLLRVL